MNKDIGYLYIINEPTDRRWIKIGKTTNPLRRLKEYNSSFAEDQIYFVHLSEKMDFVSRAEEELIQMLCKRKRVIRSKKEWFKSITKYYTRERLVESVIENINAIENKYRQSK